MFSPFRAQRTPDRAWRVDEVFAAAENDLHNLVQAIERINGQRTNQNWNMVFSGVRYGASEIRIDGSIRRAQPPDAVRGNIARIMLHIQDSHGFRLSRQDRKLCAWWTSADPPNAWKIERDERTTRVPGKANA